ncbi:acetoin utilization protein [Devosia epidermidihirudinis]|uniref:Acetoin utilization protein n=1 Tax=Devosia epidermidihirudinis TaxID=1293439 RepID=A0A0F5QKE6_9HYPH|nr:histone deacetylase family protein [Devosia epidermidihirudinis]KKC41482.1 acetoin utilization protein [Devosia epidermidihirudinis]
MTTLLVSQPNFADHVTPQGHAERADRIRAVEDVLSQARFDKLLRRDAVSGDLTLAELVHDGNYLAKLRAARPAEGIGQLDADTFISDKSLSAAATGLGGALSALDSVLLGEVDNAFCAIRPPGHHAEIATPMGFCLINTAAIVAREAQRKYGAERVAIIDFDVHHGNGTQDIFKDDPTVFYASSHQMPLYPGTGKPSETGVGNIVNVAFDANTDGEVMRDAYLTRIIPALVNFSPDLILLSAGFDAHELDPLAQLRWTSSDYSWLTGKLMDAADRLCGNRIVSLLEGGYDLKGLAGGASHHVAMLMDGAVGRLDE